MRGSSQHVLDEAERSLHDALCVLVTAVKDPRAVYGGGCCEVVRASARVSAQRLCRVTRVESFCNSRVTL